MEHRFTYEGQTGLRCADDGYLATLSCPKPGLIEHSDRGSQYTSGSYHRLLNGYGLVGSMSRVGDRWDNAVVESFFGTLKQLHTWLTKSVQEVLPKTKLDEAIQYCLNQWHKLIRYTLDGHLAIDNNRAERAIKPFVIGRKNWLIGQTAIGVNASSILYSIIETAKANDLSVFEYIMKSL